jgi:hypothetical protein
MQANNKIKPTSQPVKVAVLSRFVAVKLNREIVEGMISTYEFLLWQNKGTDDAKECKKILNALKKAVI